MIEYIKTGLVPKFPTFFASGFFYLFAIQSLVSGIILDTIVKKNKQEFEIELNEWEDKFKEKRKYLHLKYV